MQSRIKAILSGMLLALVALIGGTALAGPAHADGAAIVGTITDPDGKPVAGVALKAEGKKGSGAATTAADGTFTIDLPDAGTFTLTIDTTTIPKGLSLAKEGDEERSILVLGGKKKVLINLTTGAPAAAAATGPTTVGGDAAVDSTAAVDDSPTSQWVQLPQMLVDGLVFGILIALGALGLNLIYGTTGLTNFSHGELLTLGAFTAIVLNELGLNIIIAAPIAIVLSAILWGWGQNKVLWRPLRKRRTGLVAAMIVSIGLAITLRYVLLLLFGGSPRSFQQFAGQPGLEIGPVFITPKAIILAILATIVILATVLWLQRSRIGKATRAVSDNPALASATGIDVERVISVVWTLGAGLAAFAGIFLGLTQDVSWNMGQRLLLVLFAAVTLGGLGTIWGAIVGALVVGLFVQLSTLVLPTEMKTVGALFVMIIILLIRPQGILGRRERVG